MAAEERPPVSFQNARNHLAAVLSETRKLADALPPYGPHRDRAGNPCHGRLHVVTLGREQWCSYDPETQVAYTNGWDDMGDVNGPEYIECACGATFTTPADLDWR